jgi:gliding motility-associated-like protein
LFGSFNRNNTFSVQLSDENGSFLTPSIIAQFPNSYEDSLFRVKLPAQVKTGTHYRIRVISSSPEAIYTDNGQDISIYEKPALTNNFLGKDTVLCTARSLLLQAPVTPGFHYTWQDNSSNTNYTATSTGKYYVTVANTGGCSTTDTILVDYKTPPIFTLGNDEGICPGQTITLQPVLPAGNYEWSNGSQTATVTITNPGLYWLQVSGNGCTKRDSIQVSAKQIPVVNLGYDTTLCEGQALYLDVTNNNATYIWQDGATQSNYTVKQPGLYTVKVIMEGCNTEAAIAVAYKTKPEVDLGKDTTLCTSASITLQAAYPGATYQWSDGTTESVLQVMRGGKYMVSLTNSCGTTRDSILVNYESCTCRYALPGAFTPNGDGTNDILRPLYNCPVSNFKWQIYNRWGQSMFISENPSKGWDGQLAGIQQPTGAYVWLVQYTDPVTGKVYQNKGTVLLIR